MATVRLPFCGGSIGIILQLTRASAGVGATRETSHRRRATRFVIRVRAHKGDELAVVGAQERVTTRGAATKIHLDAPVAKIFDGGRDWVLVRHFQSEL
jgi:hypothetical protein